MLSDRSIDRSRLLPVSKKSDHEHVPHRERHRPVIYAGEPCFPGYQGARGGIRQTRERRAGRAVQVRLAVSSPEGRGASVGSAGASPVLLHERARQRASLYSGAEGIQHHLRCEPHLFLPVSGTARDSSFADLHGPQRVSPASEAVLEGACLRRQPPRGALSHALCPHRDRLASRPERAKSGFPRPEHKRLWNGGGGVHDPGWKAVGRVAARKLAERPGNGPR